MWENLQGLSQRHWICAAPSETKANSCENTLCLSHPDHSKITGRILSLGSSDTIVERAGARREQRWVRCPLKQQGRHWTIALLSLPREMGVICSLKQEITHSFSLLLCCFVDWCPCDSYSSKSLIIYLVKLVWDGNACWNRTVEMSDTT